MPQQLPFDYDVEQAALKRRQAMIDSMTGQVMKPTQGQMIGNRWVGPGMVDALSKVLSAYFLSNHQDKLDESTKDLQGRYNTGLKEALTNYETMRMGKPAVTVPSMAPTVGNDPANPQQVTTQPAVPGDPRKAAIEAIVSSYGPMRDIGLNDLKESAKQSVTLKDLLPHADPASIPAMLTQGQAGFKPKAELKAFQPGEVVLDAGGRVFTPQGAPIGPNGGPGWGTTTINGDLYQQSATGLKKLDSAPKVIVNNSILNKGQSALAGELAKAAVDDFKVSATNVQAAKDSLDSLAKMRSVGPTFMGPTAPAAMFVAGVANAMGAKIDEQKLASSETFESESVRAWINMMNQAGGSRGLVKEESDRIARAVPALLHSPQGRKQLMQMIEDRAKKTIELGERKRQSIIRAGKADDPSSYFDEASAGPLEGIGPASSPLTPAPSVSNWPGR